jgi:hypothetical protein
LRCRDYQKGLDVLLWLLGEISDQELRERIERSRIPGIYEYREEEFPGKFLFEL